MFTVHKSNSRAFEGGGFDQVMTKFHIRDRFSFHTQTFLQGYYANVDTETLKQTYLSSSALSKR